MTSAQPWDEPVTTLHEIRLAVVGSVRFVNPDAYALALTELTRTVEVLRPVLIVSGEAEGLDQFAKAYAATHEIAYRGFPPRRPRWEPDGYKARNLEIVAACTHLLAIRCLTSRTYGSGWTADVAEKAGRPVRRVIIPIGGQFVSAAGQWEQPREVR